MSVAFRGEDWDENRVARLPAGTKPKVERCKKVCGDILMDIARTCGFGREAWESGAVKQRLVEIAVSRRDLRIENIDTQWDWTDKTGRWVRDGRPPFGAWLWFDCLDVATGIHMDFETSTAKLSDRVTVFLPAEKFVDNYKW